VDWNNDGKHDLLVGDSKGNVLIHLNNNTNTEPLLATGLYIHANSTDIRVGERAAPVAEDWNGDGKKDLIAGNMDGNILVYINKGSDADPAFDSPYLLKIGKLQFNAGTRSAPRVFDWNRDGLNDLLVGEMEGYVYYLKNEGTRNEPVFSRYEKLYLRNGDALRYPDPTGAPRSRIYVTDWNNDGLFDVLLGGIDGRIMLYLADEKPSYSPSVFIKRIALQLKDSMITLKNRMKEKVRGLRNRYLSG